MKFAVLLLAIGAATFANPGIATAKTSGQTLMHDGKERTFLLSAPDDAASRRDLPLVIALHPYPTDARVMAHLSGFSALAEREGFVVAYPQGINGGYNALSCCGGEDDVGFVNAVVEKVAETLKIDRSRVYATGISNGGDFSYRLAAELPGMFAAIAPVSGGMTGDWIRKPSGNLPQKPVSLIAFHGKRDTYYETFDTGTEFWLEKLGCQTTVSTLAGTNVELTEGKCADGSVAKIYMLPDMGHAWPGGPGTSSLGFTASPIDASELIWEFFRALPKR